MENYQDNYRDGENRQGSGRERTGRRPRISNRPSGEGVPANRVYTQRSNDGERRFSQNRYDRNSDGGQRGGYQRNSFRQYENREGNPYDNRRTPRPQYGYGREDRYQDYDRQERRSDTGYFGRPSYGERQERGGYGDRQERRPSFNRERNYENRPYGNRNYEGGQDFRSGNRNGGSYNRDDYQQQRNSRPFNRQRDDSYDPNSKYSKKKQIEYKTQFVDYSQPMRLNKFMANAGICSRREADEFIAAGAVTVNGVTVTELGTKIIPAQDKVMFKDQPVHSEKKVYILLNKPKDCVTSTEDTHARITVLDIIKNACKERVYPVGRLDRNTTGVLLITNDGDLALKLTHPKYEKKKIYQVTLDKDMTDEDMKKIAAGIKLEDGEIHADEIAFVREDDRRTIGLEIHSGKNRIVRRIFDHLGYHVLKLDRVYFAGLTKKNLPRGKWRFLTEKEVAFLKMAAASMKEDPNFQSAQEQKPDEEPQEQEISD